MQNKDETKSEDKMQNEDEAENENDGDEAEAEARVLRICRFDLTTQRVMFSSITITL